jgi:adenosine deaminase
MAKNTKNEQAEFGAGNQEPVWVPTSLPKAEMHVHVGLALSVEMFIRRVKKKRTSIKLDFLVERERRYFPTLQDFHHTYEAMRHITSTPYEVAEVTQVYLERIAREGCIYAELSFSYRPEAPFQAQIEALSEAIEVARNNTGIEARIVVTTLRDAGPEVAEEAIRACMKLKSPFVVAFGLVGDEAIGSLRDYKSQFNLAWNEAGLGLVPHVAEQSLHNAIDFLDALPKEALKNPRGKNQKVRIGHGTLMYRSSELLKRMADSGICFEVCLSANKRINVPQKVDGGDTHITVDRPRREYFQTLADHPMPDFYRAGIPICLGSDNPLLMNTNIGKEYALARKYAEASLNDCLQFTRNAISYANIDAMTEKRLTDLVAAYESKVKAGFAPTATALSYRTVFPRGPVWPD